MIVSACSPVLKAMMMSKMVEATNHRATLDNIPPAVMELLLEYMYKGEVHIPNEYLLTAIEACDYLELLELKARCVSQAPKAINPHNVISWHKFADSLNIDELKTKCSKILAESFADVSKGEEFLQLSFTEVSSCISDALEADADADDMLEATTNWVACKSHTRQNHILDMLEKIDLTRCSTECIDTEMDKHKELFYSQPAALGKLTKSVIQIANQGSSGIRKKRSRRGRKATGLIVISGQEGYNSQTDCWHLDKATNFMDFLKLPFSFPLHSVCSVPGGFVMNGGTDNTQCAMFVFSSKSWKQLQSLPDPRHCHGSIFACGKIYIFGGYRSGIQSSDVLSLELEGGQWNQEPDVPVSRVHLPEVACMDSSIFLLIVYYCPHQLLHLDLNTKTWSTKAYLPQQCNVGPRMIPVQGRLLVAGGRGKTFAQYNPTTDTWTTGNPPAIPHHLGALVCLDQKVYLIGGDKEDRVEEYDLNTKSWSVCDFRLPKKLKNLHSVIM